MIFAPLLHAFKIQENTDVMLCSDASLMPVCLVASRYILFLLSDVSPKVIGEQHLWPTFEKKIDSEIPKKNNFTTYLEELKTNKCGKRVSAFLPSMRLMALQTQNFSARVTSHNRLEVLYYLNYHSNVRSWTFKIWQLSQNNEALCLASEFQVLLIWVFI